ncbi:6717_t:CDS:2, partial [Paraglomus occultum]
MAAIRNFPDLKDLTPEKLEVFANNNFSKPLSPGTLLSSLNMTGKSPFVIRYPLSNNIIVAHISFHRSSFDTMVLHTTGACLVDDIKSTNQNRSINFSVQPKGKKAYGDWLAKE